MIERYFAGIGSRKTSLDAQQLLRAATIGLSRCGFGLRSGGSGNADLACEDAMIEVGGAMQIFWPWKAFARGRRGIVLDELPVASECYRIAEAHHPSWPRGPKDQASRRLLARNALQVLGPDLQSPSQFLLLWAPRPVLDRSGRLMDCHGGTGLAVRIAYEHRIPAFNLAVPEHARRVLTFCGDHAPEVSLLDNLGAGR